VSLDRINKINKIERLHRDLGLNPVTSQFLLDFYNVATLGPIDRIVEGGELHDKASAGIAALRGQAIEEVHKQQGVNYTDIAKLAGGLHRTRVASIAREYRDQLAWLQRTGTFKPTKRQPNPK
jgi:hypothetical protein